MNYLVTIIFVVFSLVEIILSTSLLVDILYRWTDSDIDEAFLSATDRNWNVPLEFKIRPNSCKMAYWILVDEAHKHTMGTKFDDSNFLYMCTPPEYTNDDTQLYFRNLDSFYGMGKLALSCTCGLYTRTTGTDPTRGDLFTKFGIVPMFPPLAEQSHKEVYFLLAYVGNIWPVPRESGKNNFLDNYLSYRTRKTSRTPEHEYELDLYYVILNS